MNYSLIKGLGILGLAALLAAGAKRLILQSQQRRHNPLLLKPRKHKLQRKTKACRAMKKRRSTLVILTTA